MNRAIEKQLADRAVALGRGSILAALPELAGLLTGAVAAALERGEASAPDAQQVRATTGRLP